MFKCFICQAVHVPCQSLSSHLRLDHSFYPSTRFTQNHCRRQFLTYSGFKKHLISSHEKDSCQSGDAPKPVSSQTHFHMLQDTSEVAGTSVMQNPRSECFEDNGSGQRNKENSCASIIAKLQRSGISNSAVSSVVDLEELVSGLHSQVKQQVLSAVPKDYPVRATWKKIWNLSITHLLTSILKI